MVPCLLIIQSGWVRRQLGFMGGSALMCAYLLPSCQHGPAGQQRDEVIGGFVA